jgi:hypothetical protein
LRAGSIGKALADPPAAASTVRSPARGTGDHWPGEIPGEGRRSPPPPAVLDHGHAGLVTLGIDVAEHDDVEAWRAK